jgi:methanethiol S-methyltransferase
VLRDLVIDGLIVAGFGAQHSVLATVRTKAAVGRRIRLTPLEWRSVESLVNVVYVLVGAALWRQSGPTVWTVQGPLRSFMWLGVGVGWLWYWQLHLFEYDVGLAFGSTTVIARMDDRLSCRLAPWSVGTRRWIRFPVHTAFFLMFLAFPTMSASTLVLGVVANIYNVVGSIFYDRRLEAAGGEEYAKYQRATGLLTPAFQRARGGARAMFSGPRHWNKPSRYLPGLIAGLAAGTFYWFTLRSGSTGIAGSVAAAAASLSVAIVGGLLLGVIDEAVLDNSGIDVDQRQTNLATLVAVMSAVGIVVWVGIPLVRGVDVPTVRTFLPMWFIVQYVGHIAGFVGGRAVARRDAKSSVASKSLA